MGLTISLFVLLSLVASFAEGQSAYPSCYKQNECLLTSPGAFKLGLSEYDNPALTSLPQEPDFTFLWSDQNENGMHSTGGGPLPPRPEPDLD